MQLNARGLATSSCYSSQKGLVRSACIIMVKILSTMIVCLILLLLQLRGYIKAESVYAGIDESRGATTANRVSFDDLIESYGDDRPNLVTDFSITYPHIIFITVLVIICMQLVLSYCAQKERKMGNKRNLTREVKAAIISFAIISLCRLGLIVALDCMAVNFTMDLTDDEFKEIHYEGPDGQPHSILYHSPVPLLIIDVVAFIAHVVIDTIAICLMHCSSLCNRHCQSKFLCAKKNRSNDRDYYCLALTLFAFLVSIMVHIPYIAIAYLNDATYAGSVFIFYTIVTFLEFIILELTFISWFKLHEEEETLPSSDTSTSHEATSSNATLSSNTTLVIAADEEVTEEAAPTSTGNVMSSSPIEETARDSREEAKVICCSCVTWPDYCKCICIIVFTFVSILLLYILVIISVCFFYYLPINHSISSTSNQIIIVYQTGLVFVGAVIMYKTVFKRRNPLIKALDSCEDDEKRELLEQTTSKSTLFAGMWQTLTDQEKLVIFHKFNI